MTNRPLKPIAVALSALMTMGVGPASVPQARDADKPGDGVVSPAACAVYGFTLPEAGRSGATLTVGSVAALPTGRTYQG